MVVLTPGLETLPYTSVSPTFRVCGVPDDKKVLKTHVLVNHVWNFNIFGEHQGAVVVPGAVDGNLSLRSQNIHKGRSIDSMLNLLALIRY